MTATVGSPSTAAAAPIRVRDAEDADIAAVTAIYAHHVRFGLGSFEETAPDPDQIAHRRREVLARGLPYLVACDPDRAVSGFAFARRQMVAVIGDSANAPSIELHAGLGFRTVGVLHAVGFKHDRWIDTVLMQRALGSGAETDPPPD